MFHRVPILLALAVLTFASVSAEEVEFRFDPPGSPSAVFLAGDFNNWNPSGKALTDADGDGVYTLVLDLPPGKYQYKFVVGSDWLEDPDAKDSTDDGFGGKNSVIVVAGSSDAGGFVGGTGGGAGKVVAKAKVKVKGAVAAGEVEFSYTPDQKCGQVCVAGEFNGWNTTANPMVEKDGTWTTTLDLSEGSYAYKFVADGNWIEDPNAAESVEDGYGGQNSVVVVRAGGAAPVKAEVPAAPAAPAAGVPAGAVEFSWTPDQSYNEVFLAGEFNGWNTTANPMVEKDGTWTTALDLSEGSYPYKFVADGNWIADPNAAETVDDGYGGENSVIVVGAGGAAPVKAKAPAAPAAAGVPAGAVGFSWTPDQSYSEVFLAGEFNGWNTTANPMVEKDGTWTTSLDLAEGSYPYKFVADGNWIADPNAAETVDDGYGGENSVIVVGAAGAAPPAEAPEAVGDATGEMKDVTFSYAPLISGIGSCHLVGEFNGWDQTATPMYDEDGDGTWETTIPLAPGKYQYKLLIDGNTWLEDPNAADSADDGYGGSNSVIIIGAAGEPTGPGKPRRVTFEYRPSSPPKELSLAGTFNNWAPGKTLMSDPDGDGLYSITLMLPEDTYQYKFVADGNWITDDTAESFTDDGFGGKNSIVVVDESFPGITLELGDGKIFTEGLEHRQTAGELNRISDEELEFTVRTYQNDVEAISIGWDRGHGTTGGGLDLAPFSTDATFQYWRASLTVDGGVPDLRYEIYYRDGDKKLAQGRRSGTMSGFMGMEDRGVEGEAMFLYSEEMFPRFTTPDWVRDGVFYQIFPERFANGDRSNDPDFSEPYYDGRTRLPQNGKTNDEYYHLVEDWYDVSGLSKSPYRTDGKPDWYSFYGGDIEGVRRKLDYLADLGVTILYFNPLFEARSNHKYEAYDYKSIDPHFATPEEFKVFVQEAHERGIRIVADWVINHIGEHSPYFQDTVNKGKKSEYWNWFEWKKWPLPAMAPDDWREYYECWWGFAHMPDLNFDLSRAGASENGIADTAEAEVNWPVVNYVLESARWWLGELDVDGFRLDVPTEVPFWVWKIFRDEVRRIKPDAYLVGEIWSDAGDWISPDCFDATMNYKYFKDPVMDFIGKGRIAAPRFDRALATGRMAYPVQASRVMMNLVGGHDTPRYLTAVGGDRRRLHLTALFQMTYIGAPHIYYGDEIATRGAGDPDCRRTFDWKWRENDKRSATHEWYRKLIHLRRDHPALVTGSFQTLVAEGPLYAYVRRDGDDTFVVVMNVADREIEIGVPVADLDGVSGNAKFEDVVGSHGAVTASGGSLRVKLDPVSGTVFRLSSS